MAHPVVLRNFVKQYEALRLLHAEQGSPEAQQRMNDIAYTLCVATGTRDVDAALIAARHRLPGARVEDDSLISA
jgi:alpha-D-ribose 1-methylphosphonate 5-phosphate C-P lyase